jgi:hypothetical protein
MKVRFEDLTAVSLHQPTRRYNPEDQEVNIIWQRRMTHAAWATLQQLIYKCNDVKFKVSAQQDPLVWDP